MKTQIWLASLILLISSSVRAQYPAGYPGDADYHINGVHWPIDVEYTGATWGYLPDCNNYHTTLNFYYPTRETDPVGTQKFTLMQYEVYKQNYLTGASSLAYAQNSSWIIDPGSLTGNALIQHNMAPNGEGFNVEPFHLYHIKIWTRKGHQNFSGNVVPNLFSVKETGYTQTINFGRCENECKDHWSYNFWELGTLNSAASNQALGIYNPLYEAENYIESTTNLNANEELRLDAGEYVRLLPGFHAAYGSDFIAYIDGCGGRTEKLTNNPMVYPIKSSIKSPQMDVAAVQNDYRFKVYPNPSNGHFTVSIEGHDGESILEVLGMMGQVIYSYQGELATHNIDLTEEGNGIYLVRVSQGEKQYVERIVKQ